MNLENLDFSGIRPQQTKFDPIKKYYQTQLQLESKNKFVMDVGAGNGILSFFAVNSGAAHVWAVEKNPVVCQLLKKAVKNLGYQDKITVINSDIYDLDLKAYQVDIFVSEMLHTSITNNIFPHMMKQLKSSKPAAKFIPGSMTWTMQIGLSEYLDQATSWGYGTNIDNELDKSVLPMLKYQPMKVSNQDKFDWKPKTAEVDVLKYDFNQNTVVSGHMELPKNKSDLWLRICWLLENSTEVFNPLVQEEYVPLNTSVFENVDCIGLIQNKYLHKIESVRS